MHTDDTRSLPSPLTRRSALASAVAAAGGWALASWQPRVAAAAESEGRLAPKSTVLFQGDSITDAGRDRRRDEANSMAGLGRGYPYLVAGWLLANRVGDGLSILNRGISGHRVPDLDSRWQGDTIDLKPDLVSILIGVNDIWHKLNGKYDGTVADYERGFTKLLERTRESLPKARLVICEPFVLRCGAVNDRWFPEFDERRAAARRVAEAAKATWVPFQSMFDAATQHAEPAYWAHDGVHPTLAGHALMAKTWIETVQP